MGLEYLTGTWHSECTEVTPDGTWATSTTITFGELGEQTPGVISGQSEPDDEGRIVEIGLGEEDGGVIEGHWALTHPATKVLLQRGFAHFALNGDRLNGKWSAAELRDGGLPAIPRLGHWVLTRVLA